PCFNFLKSPPAIFFNPDTNTASFVNIAFINLFSVLVMKAGELLPCDDRKARGNGFIDLEKIKTSNVCTRLLYPGPELNLSHSFPHSYRLSALSTNRTKCGWKSNSAVPHAPFRFFAII